MSIKEKVKNKKYEITVAIGYNGSKRINHYETFYGGKSIIIKISYASFEMQILRATRLKDLLQRRVEK